MNESSYSPPSSGSFNVLPDRAMSAVAADDEAGSDLDRFASVVHHRNHNVVLLIRRNKCGFVLNASAFTLQRFDEQSLRHILRNHRDERIWSFLRRELHVRKRAPMCNYRDRSHAVRFFKEWTYDSRHIENFKRSGKDCERFGVFGL